MVVVVIVIVDFTIVIYIIIYIIIIVVIIINIVIIISNGLIVKTSLTRWLINQGLFKMRSLCLFNPFCLTYILYMKSCPFFCTFTLLSFTL